jgi:hypothetical protein
MGLVTILKNLATTVVASVLLIFLGIVYYMINMWIIKTSAVWAGLSGVTGNTILLTAGIITAAAIIGSAMRD